MDALRLEQAARNLLEHAITFSPGGCLDVSVHQVAGGPGGTGGVGPRAGGVAPEKRTHLFEPFYEAYGSSHRGAGIETRYQAGIVAQHGGTIRAAFPDEGGTRMVVPLPGGDRSP